jgi:hypothetical protein
MSENEFTAKEFNYFTARADELLDPHHGARAAATAQSMVEFGWTRIKADNAGRAYVGECFKVEKILK